MSVQDIDSISAMMLGELRDVHNLEKEVVETKEAVVLQEHRFEQEVENFCVLEKRKMDLEHRFADITVKADVEIDRASHMFQEHMSRVHEVDLEGRAASYFAYRDQVRTELRSLTNTVQELEVQLKDTKNSVDMELRDKVERLRHIALENKELLRGHQDTIISMSIAEDKVFADRVTCKAKAEKLRCDMGALHTQLQLLSAKEESSRSELQDKQSALHQQLSLLHIDISEAKDKSLLLEDTLKTLSTDYDDKSAERDQLLLAVDAVSTEIRSIENRCIEFDCATTETATSIQGIMEEQAKKKGIVAAVRSDIVVLRSQSEALHLRAANFSFTDSSNLDLENLEAQLQTLLTTTEDLFVRSELLISELSECTTDSCVLSAHRDTLDDLNTAVENGEAHVKALKVSARATEDQINGLEIALGELMSHRALLVEANRVSEVARSTNTTDLEQKACKLQELHGELNRMEGQVAYETSLRCTLADIDDSCNAKTIEVDALKREIMEGEIKQEVALQAASKDWFFSEVANCIEGYEAKIVSKTKENIRSLKRDLRSSDKDFKKEFKRLEAEYSRKKQSLLLEIGEARQHKQSHCVEGCFRAAMAT